MSSRTPRRRGARARPRAPRPAGASAAPAVPPVELANGLVLTDDAPGAVGRYMRLAPGAWLCARVLLYKFGSFPRLWRPDDGMAGAGAAGGAASASAAGAVAAAAASGGGGGGERGFQYNWLAWLARLEDLPRDRGPWRDAALALAGLPAPPDARTVEHMARAAIELALRDAEVERAAARAPTAPAAPAGIADERAFMARARTATSYAPRATQVQRFIFQALEACNASLLQRIADDAPADHPVWRVVQGAAF